MINKQRAKSARKQKVGIVATALLAFGITHAQADPFDDWLAGSNPKMQFDITYDGPPIELKFSHPAPPASIVPPLWQKSFEWLSKATDGKLTVKEFGSQTLVGVRDGFKGVGAGISDFGTCYVIFEPRGFELSKVFSEPFITTGNPMKDTRIFYEVFDEYLRPEWDRRKVNYGSSSPIGVSDIMSREPVRKLDDLKGKKVIWQGGPPDAAKAMGFVTLNVPFPEIYTSFQQGIVDAVMWTDAGFVPFKIYEIAKTRTSLDLNSPGIDICFNRDMYADLPADLQKPFLAMQQALGGFVAQRTGIEFQKKALGIYKESGVEFLELDPGERTRMVEAANVAVDAWAAKLESDGKPARALLAKIAELKAQYADTSDEEMMRIIIDDQVPNLVR